MCRHRQARATTIDGSPGCNTRAGMPSQVVDFVRGQLDAGRSPAEAAAALCDHCLAPTLYSDAAGVNGCCFISIPNNEVFLQQVYICTHPAPNGSHDVLHPLPLHVFTSCNGHRPAISKCPGSLPCSPGCVHPANILRLYLRLYHMLVCAQRHLGPLCRRSCGRHTGRRPTSRPPAPDRTTPTMARRSSHQMTTMQSWSLHVRRR